VAVRANAEARFNAPPHQSELNFQKRSFCAVLGNVPGYLGFKAHRQRIFWAIVDLSGIIVHPDRKIVLECRDKTGQPGGLFLA
jgi:hypothetical protein